jgi:GMP synthase (glutamine-hydrolysing)
MSRERILVFQHIACEHLGTFAPVLAARGFQPQHVRLFAGDSIPSDWPDAGGLIFLGGPMSVNDEGVYSYLAAEKAVIRQALAAEQPTLGVCLGSQLLASATGSRVFPGTRPEIGWEPVSLTTDGRQDPLLSNLGHLAAAFHWHGETFDLPRQSVRLASSALTMNQAFRLGRTAYGLQFHVEIDAAMIDSWIREYPRDLGSDPDGAARRITADTASYLGPLRTAAGEAMNRFLDLVTTRPA